jgi:hypothetical protein
MNSPDSNKPSAGLKTTGASNGGCTSSTGQVYVRGATFGNYFALMYACKYKPCSLKSLHTYLSRVHAER